jgi:ribonuclease HII
MHASRKKCAAPSKATLVDLLDTLELPADPASLYEIEAIARSRGYSRIVGVDEAGRGPLAGPVVAAAVSLPESFRHEDLDDSKAMTEAQREDLFDHLLATADVVSAAAVVSTRTIDALNILRATDVAMRRAVQHFENVDLILVDGLPVPGFTAPCRSIVKGDAKCACIAAASVIAKVLRDRLMTGYAERYPGYGFETHKGYGTKGHLAALDSSGPTPIHRLSFAPVAKVLAKDAQGTFEF